MDINILKKNLPDYLALSMVLSYLAFHNIIIVFSGIILSFYLLNQNFIHSRTKSNNTKNKNFKESNIDNSSVLESNANKLIQKDYKIKLVDQVEELGYIPSKYDNDNDISAA